MRLFSRHAKHGLRLGAFGLTLSTRADGSELRDILTLLLALGTFPRLYEPSD